MKNNMKINLEDFFTKIDACPEFLDWFNDNPGKSPKWYWDNCPNPTWLQYLLMEIDEHQHYYFGAALACLQGFLNKVDYVQRAIADSLIHDMLLVRKYPGSYDSHKSFLTQYGDYVNSIFYDCESLNDIIKANFIQALGCLTRHIGAGAKESYRLWGPHDTVYNLNNIAKEYDEHNIENNIADNMANRIREYVPWLMVEQMIKEYLQVIK